MPILIGKSRAPKDPTRARNKLWAQDAIAEIELLKIKLNLVHIRADLACATGSRKASTNDRRSEIQFAVSEEPPWSDRRPGKRLGMGSWLRAGLVNRLSRSGRHLPGDGHWSPEEVRTICASVQRLLDQAEKAANGQCPKYRMLFSWWSGNCTEATFRNIHNAEATLAKFYNQRELRAEVPEAVRRARESLSLNDPMRDIAQDLLDSRVANGTISSADLSKVIEAGHAAADRQRSRLHTFRNVLMVGILVTTLLLLCLIALAAWKPALVPLCFVQDPPPVEAGSPNVSCPARSRRETDPADFGTVSSRLDFFIVATLGLMGGALSAALFIRDLYSNSTPYNVSVPLAMLKLPAGALTALVGIILLAGEFVPGFSAIDKSIQILAYALVFGFAQQIFTQFLDQRAQRLINSIPTKTREVGASTADGSSATMGTRAG